MRILKLIVAAGLLASTAACAVYTTDTPRRSYAYYGYYDTHPTYYAYRYN
jgi:hypothetical protein